MGRRGLGQKVLGQGFGTEGVRTGLGQSRLGQGFGTE